MTGLSVAGPAAPASPHPDPDPDPAPAHWHGNAPPAFSEPGSLPLPVPASNAREPEPDHHHRHDGPPQHVPDVLTFSDLPSDLTQLGPSPSPSQSPSSMPPVQAQTPTQYPINTTNHSTPDYNNAALPPIKSNPQQPRKPSPGLAARLKALGFGSARHAAAAISPHPPVPERIGRLDEDQLRFLDENHQLNSAGIVVERRGRAWKGAGAPLQLLRSRSSRDSFRSTSSSTKKGAGKNESNHKASSNNSEPPLSPQPTADPASRPDVLPEITETPPLDMDTNEYRLSDHTNGNGTEATPDARHEHLEPSETPPPDMDSETPPPPLPKDTPPEDTASDEFDPGSSYFNPLGLHRSGSIYTISRLSFASQLSQLTALQLPDAELLSSKVAAIPTAQAATKALIGAAEQIRDWISKAAEVIEGLDSDDDVEWAAAGGREGYEDVENAITRFEQLINVYVGSIEALQSREDIPNVSAEDLQRAVSQMESITTEWSNIRKTLNSVKNQVETAMEWEELWNMVLGDIQNEMDDLSRLVFEMEERRHKSIMAVSNGEGVDIGDLETIVEETPPAVARNSKRFSVPAMPMSPTSPGTPGPGPGLSQDDSSLLALFARMQPLRASLDFLPMRLSVFEARASGSFPTACDELEMRRTGLEASYKKLEKDADSLRKELGEDKWVIVFRGAGRQAQKMLESVERSMAKLREAVEQGLQLSNPPAMGKRIESYEAKKMHYGPAIERVLSIIDKGVKDRLTVNGEILRLHSDMQSRWESMKQQTSEVDIVVEEIQADSRSRQLRDSVSSMLSNERSTAGSGIDTPGTSPPSSVVMSSLGFDPRTPAMRNKNRSSSTSSHLSQPSSTRRAGSGLLPRRPAGSRLSFLSATSSVDTPPRSGSATPQGSRSRLPKASGAQDGRPRWNGYVTTKDADVGHNFKPTTPSPYRKGQGNVRPLATTPANRESKLPLLSPLARQSPSSPVMENSPYKRSTSRLSSFRDRLAAASPVPSSQPSSIKPRQRLSSTASSSDIADRRASLQPPRPQGQGLSVPETKPRSASSLATSRRTSLLPLPRASDSAVSGRRSAAGSRIGNHKDGNAGSDKPRWRF
ncbi:KAR9-domain-containing protein [Xylariomycetidae sp. FL0641]|nr:KAR9-domain-containing protein [Xylariomycetidae sp. FL0641]